jgi:hypothetical protein
MISRASLMLMMMVQISNLATAAEEAKAETEAPAVDFIEFLGEWETNQGEWIDPNELETEVFTEAYRDVKTEETPAAQAEEMAHE